MERRLLQIAVAIACIVPLYAGGRGAFEGPAMLKHIAGITTPDLESHFRYLSGLLLGIGLVFLACIPRIERRTEIFTALATLVVVGGLARAWGYMLTGAPSRAHVLALGMGLLVTPGLALWQRRVARQAGRG